MNSAAVEPSDHVRRLGDGEKLQFAESGFVSRLPLFSGLAVTRLQQRFGQLVALLPERVGISRVNNWHKANRWVYELCHLPAILDYVEGILGPQFFHWGASFFCKSPGDDTEVPWHQDAQYWPLHPHKAVTVWLAFFDTDESNGAMRVVRGSHRQGALAHVDVNDDRYMLAKKIDDSMINPTDIVSLNLPAGELSLHDDAIIHGSPPNRSTRMRAGLTMRFSRIDVQCDLDVWPTFESYPARGKDKHPLNPVGKIPSGDGFPTGAMQSSSEFTW